MEQSTESLVPFETLRYGVSKDSRKNLKRMRGVGYQRGNFKILKLVVAVGNLIQTVLKPRALISLNFQPTSIKLLAEFKKKQLTTLPCT